MSASRQIIRGLNVISAVGTSVNDWKLAATMTSAPVSRPERLGSLPVFSLSPRAEGMTHDVASNPRYENLDRTTTLALAVADVTLSALDKPESLGCISLGSSRGPTAALERAVIGFANESENVSPLTSPTTTAGNLSSWVAQHHYARHNRRATSSQLPEVACVSTSMTCSSAFHSLLVASSFLRAGFSEASLFGGSEACLTPFSLAQLTALRIYSRDEGAWPCRPFANARDGDDGVVLGEGAGTALLVPDDGAARDGDLLLLGLGWALEEIPSATGISHDGAAFKRAMSSAASALAGRKIDLVIAHAPGSLKGDSAEINAIRAVFGDVPISTTKHLTGHTYGASGMLSLALAQAILYGLHWPPLPYELSQQHVAVSNNILPEVKTIAINTAGFGGNAITAVVVRP